MSRDEQRVNGVDLKPLACRAARHRLHPVVRLFGTKRLPMSNPHPQIGSFRKSVWSREGRYQYQLSTALDSGIVGLRQSIFQTLRQAWMDQLLLETAHSRWSPS